MTKSNMTVKDKEKIYPNIRVSLYEIDWDEISITFQKYFRINKKGYIEMELKDGWGVTKWDKPSITDIIDFFKQEIK